MVPPHVGAADDGPFSHLGELSRGCGRRRLLFRPRRDRGPHAGVSPRAAVANAFPFRVNRHGARSWDSTPDAVPSACDGSCLPVPPLLNPKGTPSRLRPPSPAPWTASPSGRPAGAPPPHAPPTRTNRHPARLAIRSPSAHSPSGPLPTSDQLKMPGGAPSRFNKSPRILANHHNRRPTRPGPDKSILNYPSRIKPLRPHQELPVTASDVRGREGVGIPACCRP
jgi:hypothetical protein